MHLKLGFKNCWVLNKFFNFEKTLRIYVMKQVYEFQTRCALEAFNIFSSVQCLLDQS